MGYEIYVPSNNAIKVWEQIHSFGRDFGLITYGTETMHLLRAEKGYILVGQDTDGSITPIDLGLNWMIGKTKSDFLGKRSLTRSDTIRTDRKQLVGILPSDKKERFTEDMLGLSKKIITKSEKKNISKSSKTLVAIKDIKYGEKFTKHNLGIMRAGSGINPCEYFNYLGKKSSKNIKIYTKIKKNYIGT